MCDSARRRADAGFTLLEAVVAVTLVGLTAVASLAAFGAELRAGDRARSALEADALTEEQLARLRLLPVQLLSSLPDSIRTGTFAAPFGKYQWEGAVHVVPGEPDLYEATVRVRWPDGVREVQTRLFRPGRTAQ